MANPRRRPRGDAPGSSVSRPSVFRASAPRPPGAHGRTAAAGSVLPGWDELATPAGLELLERVGLTAAADRRVGTYSGGMRRRLDLALSLVHEPSVLFLDEPTTGLDPMSRLTLWEEVRRLNTAGTTVLLTTQYLEEADQLADRIAIIDNGHIVRQGVPRDLKAQVGSPTLSISVDRDHSERAKSVLSTFGELRPSSEGTLGVGLARGAEDVAAVIRALDEAGLKVKHLELDEPSLDDVFAEATGHRLEGATTAPESDGAEDVPDAKRGRARS